MPPESLLVRLSPTIGVATGCLQFFLLTDIFATYSAYKEGQHLQ